MTIFIQIYGVTNLHNMCLQLLLGAMIVSARLVFVSVIFEEKVVVGCLQRILEQSDKDVEDTLVAGDLCYYMRKHNVEYKALKPCGPGMF